MEVSRSGYRSGLLNHDLKRVSWVRIPPPPQIQKSSRSGALFVFIDCGMRSKTRVLTSGSPRRGNPTTSARYHSIPCFAFFSRSMVEKGTAAGCRMVPAHSYTPNKSARVKGRRTCSNLHINPALAGLRNVSRCVAIWDTHHLRNQGM
jgi:hypothetical protein